MPSANKMMPVTEPFEEEDILEDKQLLQMYLLDSAFTFPDLAFKPSRFRIQQPSLCNAGDLIAAKNASSCIV